MISVPVFDVDAVRVWEDTPLPDTAERYSMWNQIREDVGGCCDQIEILTAALLEARAQTKGFQ
jgi:hypothetical protein